MERSFIYKEKTGSTNSDLKELIRASDRPVYAVLRAGSQTDGRGRLGRSFFSPAGGLYFSASFPLTGNEKNIPAMTLLTGLFVCETLGELCGTEPLIKWPNDIFLNGKKLCGILCELVSGSSPTVVTGIGLNLSVLPGDIPPELSPVMTSLAAENTVFPPADMITQRIVGRLDRAFYEENALGGTLPPEYAEKIRRLSFLTGKEVTYNTENGVKNGIFTGISDTGAALIETVAGTETVFYGEITIQKEK